MTSPHAALLQSMRNHANYIRRSILKDGPYAKLFDRAADTIEALQQFKEWAEPQCQDYAANRMEIERLTAIVQGLTAGAKRAGYDCPHCHAQIVFGDSVCPVTKEQHAAPVSPEWPLCEKCQKRMIQVAHDTWEYNCEHGTL